MNENTPTPMSSGGINDVVIAKLIKHVEESWKNNIRILDIGTWKWYNPHAIQKKLQEKNILAEFVCTDIDASGFMLRWIEWVEFIQSNLNEQNDFWEFDYVVGTEIIEHLENPYHFIRFVCSSLKDDGVAFITSPSVENIISYARNLIVGLPLWFDINEVSGHIMPIYRFMVAEAIRRVNLSNSVERTVEYDINRSVFPLWKGWQYFVTLPFKAHWLWEINIFTIKKG